MIGDQGRKEAIDRAGREILLAARATDAQTQQAAEAPFLYARIRARIAEEQNQTAALQESSLIWAVARRAIPALALIAIIAISSFWVFGSRPTTPTPSGANSIAVSPITAPEQPSLLVSACSLAAKDECAVSTGDVVALLINTSGGQNK